MAQKEFVGDNDGMLESEALEHRPDLLGCPTADPHDPRERNASCYHARLPRPSEKESISLPAATGHRSAAADEIVTKVGWPNSRDQRSRTSSHAPHS